MLAELQRVSDLLKVMQWDFNSVRSASNDETAVLKWPAQSDSEANEDLEKDVNSKPEPKEDRPPVEDYEYYQSPEELKKKKTKSEQEPGTEVSAASLKERVPSASILSPLEIGE